MSRTPGARSSAGLRGTRPSAGLPGARSATGLSAALVLRARELLGEDAVLTAPARLLPYATDALPRARSLPALVLRPADGAAVVRAVKLLHESGLPWSPRGAGTGLSGAALAPEGAAVLSLARLRAIRKIDPRGRRARVEAGVANAELDRRLAPLGFTFAPDPASASASTIGGNLAENAGGPRALRHGFASEHVLGLRVVLGDGVVLELGGDEETMGGFDFLGLWAGSRGTLAVATEATVRLTPLPQARRALLAVHSGVAAACEAVAALARAGIVPAALEIVDGMLLPRLVRSRDMSAAGHDPLRGLLESAGALLVCELAGREISIDAQCARAEEVLHASSAREVRVVGEARDVERLRAARARIHGSLGRESAEAISLDLLVPRARLPRVLSGIAACGERHGLRIAHVFHAGDAILRPTILLDGEDEQQSGRAHAACGEIQRLCIAAGGEPVSPAGVGLSRRETLELLWSSHELALMDQVRRILDPWGEVNPGKILPGGMEGRASGEEGAAADELIDGVTSPARPARREPTAETAAQAFAERVLTPGEAEIARVIRQYAENREPLTPVGGGTLMVTAVEGPRLTPEGLRAVGAYDPVAMALTVEAGVTLAEIETLLAREGQTLAWEAPDPARATIGGVVAAGYWGSKAQAYHHPKHSVLGLRAITGEGELLACGGRGMKRGLGYDLSRLLIGSRGTLGVISQLTLRTYPLAPHRAVMTLTGSGEDLIRFAEHLMVAEREWTAVDLLFDPERSLLLVGYEGPTREEFTEAEGILRRLLADLRRKGETGRVDEQLAEGEAVKGARRVSAEWLSWDEAEIIVRLVVSPGAALAVARQAREQLCGNGRGGDPERGQAGEEAVFAYKPGAHPVPVEEESDSLRFRLQVHPGIGLIRVAFMPGFREPSLRRLLLALAEMVREAKGYRAIDRAPAAHWWGWDAWGAVRELHERMRRVKLAFDPRAVLSPDLIEG